MKYIINPEQLTYIIKKFYGPIKKVPGGPNEFIGEYKVVAKLVNDETNEILAILFGDKSLALNELYFYSLFRFLNIEEGAKEYEHLRIEVVKYLDELLGGKDYGKRYNILLF